MGPMAHVVALDRSVAHERVRAAQSPGNEQIDEVLAAPIHDRGDRVAVAPFYIYVSRWLDRRRGSALALISSGSFLAGAL